MDKCKECSSGEVLDGNGRTVKTCGCLSGLAAESIYSINAGGEPQRDIENKYPEVSSESLLADGWILSSHSYYHPNLGSDTYIQLNDNGYADIYWRGGGCTFYNMGQLLLIVSFWDL